MILYLSLTLGALIPFIFVFNDDWMIKKRIKEIKNRE